MNPRHIAPLGKEAVCPSCSQGTMLLYPIVDKAGNIRARAAVFVLPPEGGVGLVHPMTRERVAYLAITGAACFLSTVLLVMLLIKAGVV